MKAPFGFSSPSRAPSPSARRTRNTRFAPESLEPRLHPSGFGLLKPAAIVAAPRPAPAPQPAPQPIDDGEPTIDNPPTDDSPVLPA